MRCSAAAPILRSVLARRHQTLRRHERPRERGDAGKDEADSNDPHQDGWVQDDDDPQDDQQCGDDRQKQRTDPAQPLDELKHRTFLPLADPALLLTAERLKLRGDGDFLDLAPHVPLERRLHTFADLLG